MGCVSSRDAAGDRSARGRKEHLVIDRVAACNATNTANPFSEAAIAASSRFDDLGRRASSVEPSPRRERRRSTWAARRDSAAAAAAVPGSPSAFGCSASTAEPPGSETRSRAGSTVALGGTWVKPSPRRRPSSAKSQSPGLAAAACVIASRAPDAARERPPTRIEEPADDVFEWPGADMAHDTPTHHRPSFVGIPEVESDDGEADQDRSDQTRGTEGVEFLATYCGSMSRSNGTKSEGSAVAIPARTTA